MGLLAALAGLAGPIVARVLIALGMSVVTVGGAAVALASLKASFIAKASEAPLAALQLIGLGGGWVAFGFIFGAMTFTLTVFALTKAVRIAGVAP